MKKLFINLTIAICAAAMLAVPSLSCSAAHTTNPTDLPTRSYFDSNNNYHRMVLGNTEGTPNKRYDVLVGDVNLYGEINFSDEVMISQYIINPEKYDFEKKISRVAADINGDGVVNDKDIKLVRSMGNKNIDPEDLVEKYIIDYFTDHASAKSSIAYRVYYNTKTCEFSVILVGDTNGDKVINYSDELSVEQYLRNPEGHALVNRLAADVDNDGDVDIHDEELIHSFVFGTISDFQF